VRGGPVYENRVFIAPDRIAEYESWIGERILDAEGLEGVTAVSLVSVGDNDEGFFGRAYQFSLESDEALEHFVDEFATPMEAEALERFAGDIEWDERILREDTTLELPAGEMPECLNCGAHLRGQYCAQCGQRGQSRLISLWELIRDAFGDLFELDSRLWKTLVPLLARPGLLTHDYLQGRRARYMPPFRMYLVLSLLFFLVAFFEPKETFGIFFEPTTEDAAEGAAAKVPAEAQEILDELAAEGIIAGDDSPGEDAEEDGVTIRVNGEDDTDCNVEEFSVDGPEWLQRRLTPERLVHICEQVKQDDGRQFVGNIVDNIPVALIVLLPIMAFVLKALYPLSRRYYVEHLLFFVHYHAFFFLILVLMILLARLNAILPIPEAIGILVIIAASFYIPVYLFVAMRRVYGQGRLITTLKYVVLIVSYFAGFTLTMLGAVTMAAFAV
jgi:hypothetical protein